MGAQASGLPRISQQAGCLRSQNPNSPSGVTDITRFRPFFVCSALLCAPHLTVPSLAQAPVPAPAPLTAVELEKIVGGPPTTVTFSGQNVKLFDAVEVVRKAGGGHPEARSPVATLEIGGRTVDITWKDTPFWKAAAQIEEITGKRWLNSSQGGVHLVSPLSAWPGDMSGPVGARTPYFLVIGISVVHDSTDELPLNGAPAPPPSVENIFNLRVYADPKVPAANGSLSNCKFQLTPGGPWTDVFERNYSQSPEAPLSDLVLVLPDGLKSGTLISRLAGTYNAELVQETQNWKIPDILAVTNVSETLAGTKLTLQSAKFEGDDLKVVVSFAIPRAPKGSFGINEKVEAIKLTDSAGRLLASPEIDIEYGDPTSTQIPIEVTLTYTATTTKDATNKGPIALDWTLPPLSRSFPVPFEFNDLKIP